MENDDFEDKNKKKKEPVLTRGAIVGTIMAFGILVYAFCNGDIPVIFLCLSFLTFMLRPFVILLGGNVGECISNILKGFSAAAFGGAIFMTFF